jgi:hypothetical protein
MVLCVSHVLNGDLRIRWITHLFHQQLILILGIIFPSLSLSRWLIARNLLHLEPFFLPPTCIHFFCTHLLIFIPDANTVSEIAFLLKSSFDRTNCLYLVGYSLGDTGFHQFPGHYYNE